MRVTNKPTIQRGTGIYRGPNIDNPVEVKQKRDASVGNSEVNHFKCQGCGLPFTQNMPEGASNHKTRLICPNCYMPQTG